MSAASASRAPAACAVALGLLAVPSAGDARGAPSRLAVTSVVTPSGVQGVGGAGALVAVPVLWEGGPLRPRFQAQYGIDRNGDARITEREFRPARCTLGLSGVPGSGSLNWNSVRNLRHGRFLFALPRLGDDGREIAPPDSAPGVQVRVRPAGRRDAWTVTDAFELDQALPPVIEGVTVEPSSSPVLRVSVRHPDSEDLDGDARFDRGEDADGDRRFDRIRVAVAADWAASPPPEDLGEWDLSTLAWSACTIDPDASAANGLRGGASHVGGVATERVLVWDAASDVSAGTGPVLVRFRATDDRTATSGWRYLRTPLTLP